MIEKNVKIFLAVFTVASALFLVGAEDVPLFEKVEVKVSLLEPPRARMSSVSSVDGKIVQNNKKWGVIRVDFMPGLGVNEKRAKKALGSWLDDVTMALQVILLDSNVKRSAGYALFDGRCDFWSISLDKRKHSIYMFVAPQILERYMPARGSGGGVRTAVPGDFKVRAIFFHKKYGVVGEGYYGFSGSSMLKKRNEFLAFKERISSRNILNGALLTSRNTPWGLNNMGDFDLEKPGTILPALNDEALEKAAQEAETQEHQESEKKKKDATLPSSSSSTKKKKR